MVGEGHEVITGDVRWHLGDSGPWQVNVGRKVGLFPTSSSQVVDAEVVLAERLNRGGAAAASIRYPRGDGPGFIFGIGLPTPGCWVLSAIGPALASSVVVEAIAGPPDATPSVVQNVPAGPAVDQIDLASCPATPWRSPSMEAAGGEGLAWQDFDSGSWTAGSTRRLGLRGDHLEASQALVIATPVGTLAEAATNRAAYVTARPVLFDTVGQAGGVLVPVKILTPGCWAIIYLDSATTSTIVVVIG
jgi:hypothetical protein